MQTTKATMVDTRQKQIMIVQESNKLSMDTYS